MARKATSTIPFVELKKICKTKGINSWPEYQKRFTEIPGAKKTLHASYPKLFKGNRDFFGNPATIEKNVPVKKASKKIPTKTASCAAKKNVKKQSVKKTTKKKATVKS